MPTRAIGAFKLSTDVSGGHGTSTAVCCVFVSTPIQRAACIPVCRLETAMLAESTNQYTPNFSQF